MDGAIEHDAASVEATPVVPETARALEIFANLDHACAQQTNSPGSSMIQISWQTHGDAVWRGCTRLTTPLQRWQDA
jgi:hypothetical protein